MLSPNWLQPEAAGNAFLDPATEQLPSDEQQTQPLTQPLLDPRRLGQDTFGLDEEDVSDVFCILTPAAPAAFHIVKFAAEHSPQHVLQTSVTPDSSITKADPTQPDEEAETFILDSSGFIYDLALRFSAQLKFPHRQFVFGRNVEKSDIILQAGTEVSKRVSNSHFRIYINEWGVLMLEDLSTNGTMVDDKLLKSKTKVRESPVTTMLTSGSVISILSPKDEECIRFHVRIPPKDGYQEQWQRRMQSYLLNVKIAKERFLSETGNDRQGDNTRANAAARGGPVVPIMSGAQAYGMRWNGKPDYNVVDQLGKGAFATVYKLATVMDGVVFAAKELEKKRFIKNGQMDKKLDNEMRIMQDLIHPNIVQYIDCVDKGNFLYIIMEYVPYGNLSEWLGRHELLPEPAAQRVACQIFSSLAYLHARKITHRDIKPDNILIASEQPFNVKLSDFGLSKVVSNNDTFLKTFCGTLLYCAPEVFPHYAGNSKGQKRRKPGESKKTYHSYSQSVDIWSFGAVLWSALCGHPPFEGVMDNTGKGMFNKIMSTDLDTTPLRKCGVSPEAIDLLTSMLNTDPAERPTEMECLHHPWLVNLARQIVPDVVRPDLQAIPEEEEEEEEEAYYQVSEDKFSQLSLSDRKAGYGVPEDSDDEEDDEEESEPEELLEIHKSKRIKHDKFHPRYQYRGAPEFDSSPEVSYASQRSAPNGGSYTFSQRAPAAKSRLFGEIGQSVLQGSGALDRQIHQAGSPEDESGFSGQDGTDSKSPRPNQSTKGFNTLSMANLTTPKKNSNSSSASDSLLGTESMVRDLHMDSPRSSNSPEGDQNEPTTPRTPEVSQQHSLQASDTPTPRVGPTQNHSVVKDTSRPSQEATPKQKNGFSREIKLPLLPSFFWRPDDESTHNNEYSSKVSGIDFDRGPVYAPPKLLSLPSTSVPSDTSEDDTDSGSKRRGSEEAPNTTAGALESYSSTDGEFRRPKPRLGNLTTTPDSFFHIVLRLETDCVTWGRLKDCSIVYPDSADTRIPKNAFTIWHHVSGEPDAIKNNKDWTKLPGLEVLIHTNSRSGIRVNGVKLEPPQPGGSYQFGKLYTGDVITVYQRKHEVLSFVCEFFHGESAKRRPVDQAFHAETSRTKAPFEIRQSLRG
ncbi:hypothetical protein IWX90DRAFT_106634 [Phyllosticta citrichinensis]|uniref:Pkinase-domain-containing protein n=1 Tax=Phyllosticta citrichinensis TaxID=1130410 RepID=A0ABR1Y313_9PEZI